MLYDPLPPVHSTVYGPPILRSQSLEDVYGNPDYLLVDCAELFDDSAVRHIYLKKSCVRDIYNMYADSTRQSNSPNESGCIVLGRWVYDKEADEYEVSFEEFVMPDDDAVFKEEEFNFGVKILVKVMNRLRMKRRESNLQYDVTGWIHLRSGKGAVFSNIDNEVHMKLQHRKHPKFLTAIVIDVSTPELQFGIFTSKHNMTINTDSELKKKFSLKEMYVHD